MQGIGQSAYPDARWADVRISYPVIAEGAAASATVSASAGISVSNVDQTHDENVNVDKACNDGAESALSGRLV